MDLNRLSSPNESFFTLWGVGILHYPAAVNGALIAVILLGFGVLAILAVRRKVLSGKGLALGSLLITGAVLLSGVLGLIAGEVFSALFPRPQPNIDKYLVPASLPYLIVALVLITLVFAILRAKIERKVGKESLALAGLLPWIIFSLVFFFLIPVGSYAFVLPALIGLISWGIVTLRGMAPASISRAILLALPLVAGILLLFPVVVLMFLSTGIDIWITAMVTVMLFDRGVSA